MNDKPITQAKDADLRGADAALRRAAARAREVARATDTRLVVSRAGKIEYVYPDGSRAAGQPGLSDPSG